MSEKRLTQLTNEVLEHAVDENNKVMHVLVAYQKYLTGAQGIATSYAAPPQLLKSSDEMIFTLKVEADAVKQELSGRFLIKR